MSATLALVNTSSAAPGSPLSHSTSLALLPPINSTSSALEAPGTLINLTVKYVRWPKDYSFLLVGPDISHYNARFYIISASQVFALPAIKLSELQRFVRDFADSLEQGYPVPGFIPYLAKQSSIDLVTYTKWYIDLHQGKLRARMPTEVILAALDLMVSLLDRHGPSTIDWAIRAGGELTPWAYGRLSLKRLVEASSKKSLPSEEGGLQTR